MSARKVFALKMRTNKRRQERNKRRNQAVNAFESHQLADLFKLDQKLVLMGK